MRVPRARAVQILGRRLIVSSLVAVALLVTTNIGTSLVRAQSMSPFCLLQGDCEPPSKPAGSVAVGNWYQSNEFVFSWDGSIDNNSASVVYRICVSKTESFANYTCKQDITATETPATDLIPANTEDTWYWRVDAQDEVGNRSDWSEAKTVTVDETDPVVTLDADTYDIGGNQPAATFTGSATDDNLTGYQLLIINQNGEVIATINYPDSLSFVWNVVDPVVLPSGQYIVQLSAHDQSGRVGIISRTVSVDNSGPDVVIVDGGLITSGSITPKVTASDVHQTNLTYQWVADEDNPGVLEFDSTILAPKFTPTVEGSYTFYLTVTDDFGNTSTTEFNFDYKRVLEPLPNVDPTNPAIVQTKDPTAPTFTPPAPRPVVVISRAGDSEASEEDVLGSTVATILAGNDPVSDRAVVAATTGGWRIVGILWYWWVVLGLILAILALVIRRAIIIRRNITPVI